MDMLRGGWGPGMLGNGQGTVGAGSSYAAETEAIAAAFTTPPTTARKNLIDACVVSLKSAGVWTKLDALYAFAAADSQAALINWKQPGTYNGTLVNAPAFAADQGFTGASTKYIDSGFNPATAPSPKFVRDSATVFGWSLTDTAIDGGIVGKTDDTIFLIPKYSTNATYLALNNDGATFVGTTSSGGSALFSGVRSDASTITIYRNGSSFLGGSATSTAITSVNIRFLMRGAQYWLGQAAAGGFGSQLSAAENTALYNALRTYLTGVGVP